MKARLQALTLVDYPHCGRLRALFSEETDIAGGAVAIAADYPQVGVDLHRSLRALGLYSRHGASSSPKAGGLKGSIARIGTSGG